MSFKKGKSANILKILKVFCFKFGSLVRSAELETIRLKNQVAKWQNRSLANHAFTSLLLND